MKKLFLLLAFCSLFFVLPASAQQTKPPTVSKDTSAYWQMAEKIKAGDLNIDYPNLRREFSNWSRTAAGKSEAPNRAEMVKAFEAKNFAKAVELGETVVPYELINTGLLRALANAYTELKNETKAKFFTELAHKVAHSLFLSGDGKTAKTAFYVLNIPEEYRVMREFGYTVAMQALMQIDGQPYDVLSGKDEKGNAVEVYFNISIFF